MSFPRPDRTALLALLRRRRGLTALVLAAVVGLGAAGRLTAHSAFVRERIVAGLRAAAGERGVELQVADAGVDWRGGLSLSGVRAQRAGVSVTAERLVLRPDWLALLGGHARLAAVSARKLELGLEPEALAVAEATPAPATGPATTHDSVLAVDVEDLVVKLGRFSRLPATTWTLASLSARLERGPSGAAASLRAELPSGGAVHLEARLAGAISGLLELHAATAPDLPPELLSRLSPTLTGAFDGKLELEAVAQLRRGRVSGHLETIDLVAGGGPLSSEPLGPVALAAELAASWSRDDRRVYLEDASLTVGPRRELTVRASGDARFDDEGPVRLAVKIDAPDTAAFVDALPAALRPPAAAPALRGPLSGEVTVEGIWNEPLEWKVDGKLDLTALRAAARQGSAGWLTQTFEYRAVDADGMEHPLVIGPESPDFVPWSELPAHVADAVTTAEDGGFYGHQGFDFEELKNSIVAVAAAGRAVRGGSTITQQLAKNLFLSREKTYARKLREAVVTLALESALSKQRLLEIYLNVIEWGPGVYGVGPAARLYFGKDARELSTREAAYLASVIPNPVRYYAQYERGELSPEWVSRLDTILAHMTANGRLDPEAYAQALIQPIVFRAADAGAAPAAETDESTTP